MADVRCPNGGMLFWKIRDDGLLEVACRDCRNNARAHDPRVVTALHVYTPAGELVDTRIVSLAPVSRRAVRHDRPAAAAGQDGRQ